MGYGQVLKQEAGRAHSVQECIEILENAGIPVKYVPMVEFQTGPHSFELLNVHEAVHKLEIRSFTAHALDPFK